MLILTRKLDQIITIGDDIQIVVMNINHSQVRLGIQAPHDIQVHRYEIYEKILKEAKKSNKFNYFHVQ